MANRALLGLATATSAPALLATGMLALALHVPLAEGKEQVAALVTVGEPEGFSSLTGPQMAVVDVYYGGRRVGEAEVLYRPESLTFAAPDALVQLLSQVKDRVAVRTQFATSLATNSHLVCAHAGAVPGCGRLEPAVAGIIFDRDRFRVDLFVNSTLLAVESAAERVYLQAPHEGLSFVDSVDAVLSGSDLGPSFYNVQNHLIVAQGTTRLRADMAAAKGFGVQAERLTLETDRPGWRYMAGAFWAPGSDLIGRRKLLGAGIETQIDTRLDRDVVRGNPLVVFLRQRARVDIMLDRRVMASGIYEAGNQTLDTTGLPDGTYEVVVRIDELGGDRREEKRLFTRNIRIPSAGQKVLFAYAGMLVDDRSSGFLDVTAHPLFQAGGAWRLSPHLAVDGTVMATDRAIVGELGAYLIAPASQLRFALIAGSSGQYGGLIQLSSNGRSPFNFHFDLRRIVAREAAWPVMELPLLGLSSRTFSQASGTLSYSLQDAQISIAASWRDEAGRGRSYAVGPTVRWGVARRGNWRLFVNGDAAFTDRGKSGYLGLNLQLAGGGLSLAARGGMRSDAFEGAPNRTGFVGAVNASVQREAMGGLLDLGAGYERDLDRHVVGGTANLRTDTARFDADVLRTFGIPDGRLQYSLGVHTTLAGTAGGVDLQGRERSEGMLLAKIEGGQPDDRFEVLVNEARAAVAAGGGEVMIARAAYREYDVRIRPISRGLVQYDASSQRAALYPGSVALLKWKARAVVPVFGRIQREDGGRTSGATVLSHGHAVEADDAGYFQIDAELDEQLEVRLSDGGACKVALPRAATSDNFIKLGDVLCKADVRFGSIQPLGIIR